MENEVVLIEARAVLTRETAAEDFTRLFERTLKSVRAGVSDHEAGDAEAELFQAIVNATTKYALLVSGNGKPN